MDKEQFRAVYETHYKAVRNYMWSLTNDPYLAEDITQEAFLKYERYHSAFRRECSEYTIICKIGKNIWLNRLRKDKKLKFQDTGVKFKTEPQESLEEKLMDHHMAEHIHMILHNLPEPYKEVFMLKVFGNLEFKQIAALFGKSESWAKMTFYRGKSKIVAILEEEDGK